MNDQERLQGLTEALNRHIVSYNRAIVEIDPYLSKVPTVLVPGLTPNPGQIIHIVADYFGFKAEQLSGPGRWTSLSHARHVAAFFMYNYRRDQYSSIGRALGKDHSSVMYGVEKIYDRLKRDLQLRADVKAIREKLGLVEF